MTQDSKLAGENDDSFTVPDHKLKSKSIGTQGIWSLHKSTNQLRCEDKVYHQVKEAT